MNRFLLTGVGGMLGTAFRHALGASATVLTRLNISSCADPLSAFPSFDKPPILINCAAHTDVEHAETEIELDESLNIGLPARLAAGVAARNGLMIHISSTGCYGDWKDSPYIETDALKPTTRHHRNKAAGEDAVRGAGCRHIIIRTGWLFGGTPANSKNFVWKRILEAQSNPRITSDAVQRGVPTAAADVAAQTLLMVGARAEGTFNVVAQGQASRYEYVKAIVEHAGLNSQVQPGPAFRRVAAVSANETALNARLGELNLDFMPNWEHSLRRYVEALLENQSRS